jgi:hypothetical protein
LRWLGKIGGVDDSPDREHGAFDYAGWAIEEDREVTAAMQFCKSDASLVELASGKQRDAMAVAITQRNPLPLSKLPRREEPFFLCAFLASRCADMVHRPSDR